MPTTNSALAQLAGRIADLERLVQQLSRTSRLGQSSIEDGAIEVYDSDGTLRGSIGVQDDGTVGLVTVNGPPPPAPTVPALASVLGGVQVTWDGEFRDGTAPADFAQVEVHTAPVADFTPGPDTLFASLYTAGPGSLVVPVTGAVWGRLVAVTTSAVRSAPSPTGGPATPAPVVAQEVLDGVVTELALADDAVTSAKLAAGAVDTAALAAGAVAAQNIGQAAVTATALADGSVSTGALAAGAVTAGKIAAGQVTTAALAAGAVTAGTIAAGAVTTGAMTAGSISGDRLAAGSIAADRIAAASITGAQIQALAITADKLAVNTITAAQIAAGAITAASGVISSVDASKITVGKLTASQIDATNLVITGANVNGAVASAVSASSATTAGSATSAGSATTVTGSIGTGVPVPAGQLSAAQIPATTKISGASILTGSVTADKVVVTSGIDLLADPSFDGPATATLITASGNTYFSQDTTTANGSAASLKLNCANATAVTRTMVLASVPVAVGDQIALGVDYQCSTDWAGTAVRLYVRWKDLTGTVLSYSYATTSTPVLGATWQRVTGTGTAPAGAVTAEITIGNLTCTAGTVWFDNASARVVLGSTQIQGGAIQTQHLAAGAITADKLTVGTGGANVVPDYSFEGAYAAALVALPGNTAYWSVDVIGNGSAKSAKVNAASPTTATRSLQLTTVPVVAGDQFYLQFDYQASTTWVGSAVKFYLRWADSTGATLGYGTAMPSTPVLGTTWQTISATVTAPAKAVSAGIWCESYQATTGTVWFDNCIVKPVTTGVTIASGSITADKLSADAIDGKTITGVTVTGSSTVTGTVLQTGTSGNRIVLQRAPRSWGGTGSQLAFYDEVSNDIPGTITAYGPADGAQRALDLTAPNSGASIGPATPVLSLSYENEGTTSYATASLSADRVYLFGRPSLDFPLWDNDGLGGAPYLGVVQDWTTVTLATGYTANGNSNGVPQYRVINLLGTNFVQWRGGVGVTYTSGNIANGGAPFSAALPAVARPSARRSVPVACSLTTYKATVKVDFNADGTVSVVGTTSTENPAWVSLNGTQYSL